MDTLNQEALNQQLLTQILPMMRQSYLMTNPNQAMGLGQKIPEGALPLNPAVIQGAYMMLPEFARRGNLPGLPGTDWDQWMTQAQQSPYMQSKNSRIAATRGKYINPDEV